MLLSRQHAAAVAEAACGEAPVFEDSSPCRPCRPGTAYTNGTQAHTKRRKTTEREPQAAKGTLPGSRSLISPVTSVARLGKVGEGWGWGPVVMARYGQ
jgi:hypothetical protein